MKKTINMKISSVLKIENEVRAILHPDVEISYIKKDKKGKTLTEAQAKKLKPEEIITEKKLDTDFWKQNPSARFQLSSDNPEVYESFIEGKKVKITIEI